MGTVQNKQEVKTDRFLPAYCDPPNPCPLGFSAEDGCDPAQREKFTADFSKLYQASQKCHCDREHNYGCSTGAQTKNKSAPGNQGSQGDLGSQGDRSDEGNLLKNNLKDLARIFADEDEDEAKGERKRGEGESNHVNTNNNKSNDNNNNNNNNNHNNNNNNDNDNNNNNNKHR